ncbi:MAG: AAA family ATPase [Spirochaetales bacterium]|nr:AAA family ATPase [Spirochaetales bacterium]
MGKQKSEHEYRTEFLSLIENIPLHTPLEMFEILSENGYVNQMYPRKAVCLMAFRHINRIKKIYLEGIDRNKLPLKENLLLMGPTGCGKTYLIELLFQKVLKLPTVIIDITSYSETGYVGQDVSTILTKLLYTAKDIPHFASVGIVCIDEFDKISAGKNTAVFAGQGTTKDVTGVGVQRELLKMFENADIDVPSELSHSTYAPRITFNTADVPFIACGTFSGFREVLKFSSENEYIGFTRMAAEKKTSGISQILSREDVERAAHFEAYGIMPELIGRFTRIIPFNPLSEDTLKEILYKNVIIRYENELNLDNIELKIDDSVFDFIVKKCIKKETGARGLKSYIMEYLEEACFTVYSEKKKKNTIHLQVKKNEIITIIK